MNQDSSQAAAGLMAGGFMLFALLIGLVFTALLVWLFWRVLTKAGMSGALSLLLLVPGIGWIIVMCILAFGTWKVVPAPNVYAANPLPPPGYPPQQLPPTNYPPRY